jgi:ATP-dependent helicase HrpB
MNRRDLPIFAVERAIADALRTQNRLILEAPTGSGKSTQTPQILLDHGIAGNGQIIILQPRRLATRLLAKRVAEERNVRLGEEVGYQIRLDRVCSDKTRIKFVTEGVLLRQILDDEKLPGVSILIFDEFHERHLYGDISLGRALQIQKTVRPDLKIVVMSATLDTGSLEKYLAPAVTVSSEGRTYPVDVEYIKKATEDRPWDLATGEFERLVASGQDGDFLIFMPGAYEINRTIQAVRNSHASRDFIVMPLHGELPPAEQDRAVGPCAQRKVIVSTNVAETSLTIEGIRTVIDSGLARIARFDPYRGINTLLIEKISRASADQRAGRAGRTAAGRCVRLWTQLDHERRPAHELPEIKRLDLSEVVLTLKASQIDDLRQFPWLEAPEERALARAETLLADLGAIDSRLHITSMGRRMLSFPMHPRYARMLLAANEAGCVRPVALIAALTQGRSLLLRSEGKRMDEMREILTEGESVSDFFVLMRAWRYADKNNYSPDACRRLGIHAVTAREVGKLCGQFLDIAESEGLDVSEKRATEEVIARCILQGFSDQLAVRLDQGTLRCALVHRRSGELVRESVIRDATLFVAAEVREIDGKGDQLRVLLSQATAVHEEWLKEFYPEDFVERTATVFDSTQRRCFATRQVLFRDLVLRQEVGGQPNPSEAATLLAKEVIEGRCPLKNWDDSVEQWILRVNCLRQWMPELAIPEITAADREAIIAQICHGALGYKDIKEHPVWDVVKDWLSGEQQSWLNRYAPERYELPNGRRAKITYRTDGLPFIGAKIQDLYDVHGSLNIASGRIQLVINVLAPSMRPIQVTQNLSTFWKESYPKIKQELQRKYPKHKWL